MADGIKSGSFDPRFDPAFQPGYDATNDSRGRPAHNGIPPLAENDVVLAHSATAVNEPQDAGELLPNGEATEPHSVVADIRDPNPFERSLCVVALAFVVGGVAAAVWANSFNYVSAINTWGWPQMIQASAWALTTPMITVGLATGVGLLFRRAITWKPDQ